MFKNGFKTAIRNLFSNKQYASINITGLSIGISVCLIIFIVTQFELSFDNFHQKKDRIYRVLTQAPDYSHGPGVPGPLPTAIKNDLPQLEQASAAVQVNLQVLALDDNGKSIKKFKENIFFTEPSFFSIFDFTWLSGDPFTTLNNPNSAVLTKETAEKYFGNWKDALGKTIRINNRFLLKVTAILADVPPNTDFQFKVIAPYRILGFPRSQDWKSIDNIHQCYVLLPSGISASAFNRQLEVFSKKYRHTDDKTVHVLQPLGEVHHDSEAGNFIGKTVSWKHIRTLWLIAVFILLIACINFINLSTAQAINRSKEVGVRKVLGSSKAQLTMQFLMETLLLVLTAAGLSVLITAVSLHMIAGILNDPLSLHVLYSPFSILFLVIVTGVVTGLAGFYPALVLSGFNPATALKSRFAAKRTKGVSLRRWLVMFQFIIAQALIIATFIVLKQMNYFESSAMGFDKETIIHVPFPQDSAGISKLDYLNDRLSAVKGIKRISFSDSAPVNDDNWWTPIRFDHAEKETEFSVIYRWIDANYKDTYQLSLIAGRNITSTDAVKEFLVNEALVKKLGFSRPQDILNKEIDLGNGSTKGPIVGVVNDFHSSSLKDELAPMLFVNNKGAYKTAGIKLTSSQLPSTIGSIEKIWNEVFPDYVFGYRFLDDEVAGFYKQERQLAALCKIFAVIAIFLSCLGLYGLASFMVIQRTKEISVRKILGATRGSIIYLFSKEFIVLIGIAFVIASSVTWHFMHQWLQNYAYRTEISGWVFVSGGLASIIIALTTISFHAIKATLTNPIKNLRGE